MCFIVELMDCWLLNVHKNTKKLFPQYWLKSKLMTDLNQNQGRHDVTHPQYFSRHPGSVFHFAWVITQLYIGYSLKYGTVWLIGHGFCYSFDVTFPTCGLANPSLERLIFVYNVHICVDSLVLVRKRWQEYRSMCKTISYT